ncbi:MAG: ABC transporter substrate-binding protein, partial [Thermoflexales bacterium]|nr:ABC transporter substrate-binding protein [Thermoflexales bacterium]
LVALLVACAPRPTIKIALVAPFEGRLRRVGYDVFPAFRLAIREQIRQSGTGRVFVTFIAYDDRGEPEMAARVARQVVLDPEVVGVIGHFVLSSTLAALPIYAEAGLPLVAPHVPANALPEHPAVFRLGPMSSSPPAHSSPRACSAVAPALPLGEPLGRCIGDAPVPEDLPEARAALAAFTELSLGPPPTPRSVVGYTAAQVLLAAVRADAERAGVPTRNGVASALRQVRVRSLLGEVSFDSSGRWTNAPTWAFAQP